MAHATLRFGGIGLIVGAALLGAAIILVSFIPVVNQPFPQHVNLLFLLSAILLLLSLPATYARQAQAAGWLGLMSYVLLQTGILLLVLVAAPSLLYPSRNLILSENLVLFLLGIALTLGLLLTGIATIQAKIYPRGTGIMLLVATVGFFFDFFLAEYLPRVAGQIGSAFFGALLALALVWIGNGLLLSKSEVAA